MLDAKQTTLLNKLISFDCMSVNDKDQLKRDLYEWFFRWDGKLVKVENKNGVYEWDNKDEQNDKEQDEETEQEEKTSQDKEKEREKAKKEAEKRLELMREKEMMEFEERGGFSQVLKDIFNPSDLAAMELDSVFQLKNLCKDFYRKKQLLSGNLI